MKTLTGAFYHHFINPYHVHQRIMCQNIAVKQSGAIPNCVAKFCLPNLVLYQTVKRYKGAIYAAQKVL